MSQTPSESRHGSLPSNDSTDPPTLLLDSGMTFPGHQQPSQLPEYVPIPRATHLDANSKSGNVQNVDGLGRRKNTSFKITNILSSAPAGNDQEESGEEDPDDSRTEDISDNVEDILYMQAPVGVRRGSIPVELTATLFPMAELATFIDGNSSSSIPGQGPVHGPRDRFKVVKIETVAPHRRGRWTCVQYADKNVSVPSVQQSAVSVSLSTLTTTSVVMTQSANADPNAGGPACLNEDSGFQSADQINTPRIMSPMVENKDFDENDQKIPSFAQYSGANAQPSQTGAKYSTSPIPFSSHSTQGQNAVSGVPTFHPSTPQVSSSQAPMYTPVSMATSSASHNTQPTIAMSQAQSSSIQQVPHLHQTMQIPPQGLIQQHQSQTGFSSQSIQSQSMAIPQQVSMPQNKPSVIMQPPIQQQAPIMSNQGIQAQPQSGVMPQPVIFPQQMMTSQGSTFNQPVVMQQQQQPQPLSQQIVTSQTTTLPQPMVMSQSPALPQPHSMTATQAAMNSQSMPSGQSVPMSQLSPLVQPVVICQIPSSQVSSSSVVSMATTSDLVVSTSSQCPVPSSSSTFHKYDPLTSSAIHSNSGLQSPSSSSHIPYTATVSTMFGGVYSTKQQHSPVQQQSQFQQLPHSQYQQVHQQPTYPSSQSITSAQSSLQQQQQTMQQIPQQQGQQSTVLTTTQAPIITHQTTLENQGTIVMQQNNGANNTGSVPIVITSQASQTLFMAPMSRPVPTGQQSGVSQGFLSVSSPLVLPSNSTSTVNSMPPSRDPVSGGPTHLPIMNPAARDPSYVATHGTFPDSQPVASDLLVERLEEISTQQELADDPDSASGSNQGAIDNRIEQAMDLVKSHLMNAVRSEVDELKERIVKLEEIIAQLQTENEFFRANVHRDVLLQLQQQQQAPGSPASQQALQMIQQPSNQQPPQI